MLSINSILDFTLNARSDMLVALLQIFIAKCDALTKQLLYLEHHYSVHEIAMEQDAQL